jgi:hypothetical protein
MPTNDPMPMLFAASAFVPTGIDGSASALSEGAPEANTNTRIVASTAELLAAASDRRTTDILVTSDLSDVPTLRIGESLLKGVVTGLPATVLSIKPGGTARLIVIAGGVVTHGNGIEALEMQGKLEALCMRTVFPSRVRV